MKPVLLCFWVALALGSVNAQVQIWRPSAGHTQVPIWPGTAPDARRLAGPEYVETVNDETPRAVVSGKVSTPTMTVYPPEGKNTGAAVVVFPGGGYWVLYISKERRSVTG